LCLRTFVFSSRYGAILTEALIFQRSNASCRSGMMVTM
jgi:hypothetical protein